MLVALHDWAADAAQGQCGLSAAHRYEVNLSARAQFAQFCRRISGVHGNASAFCLFFWLCVFDGQVTNGAAVVMATGWVGVRPLHRELEGGARAHHYIIRM